MWEKAVINYGMLAWVNMSVLLAVLTEGATDVELQMLLSELAILKYVNSQPHPNIIALIGCCTQGTMFGVYYQRFIVKLSYTWVLFILQVCML